MSETDSGKVQQAKSLASKLHQLLNSVDSQFQENKLREMGLLSGLDAANATAGFLDKLNHERQSKRLLARHLLETGANYSGEQELLFETYGQRKPNRLFIESGTTFIDFIADVVGDAPRKQGDQKGVATPKVSKKSNSQKAHHLPDICYTNSLYVQTAWVKHVRDVYSLPGRFLDEYHGWFPFSHSDDDPQGVDEDWGLEGVSTSVSCSDMVLATCSKFSFETGPLVSSRENALFKHAMFAGINDQSFVLMFDYKKYVPFGEIPSGDGLYRVLGDKRHDETSIGQRSRQIMNLQYIGRPLSQRRRAKNWFDLMSSVNILIGFSELDDYKAICDQVADDLKRLDSVCGTNSQMSPRFFAQSFGIIQIKIDR